MHPLEHAIDTFWPRQRWRSTRLLLAVSGGADSVALLRALVRLEATQPRAAAGHIQAAHFNHGWRGAESDGDEAFVSELCQQLQVPLTVGRPTSLRADRLEPQASSVEFPQQSTSARTEENARKLRYEFLIKTAYQCGGRYVLTAHTANDRVETMLHNLFRGTGISGVVGPAATRNLGPELVLVRPLLGCWRQQVEAYLGELGQDYRIDCSNADETYQRNYLRHTLLPELRQRFDPQLDARLLAFSELAEEAQESLRTLASSYLGQVAKLRAELLPSAAITPANWPLPPASATHFSETQLSETQLSETQWNRKSVRLPNLDYLSYPWPVVRQALVQIWQEQGWPLQAMARQQWDRLRELMSPAEAIAQVTLPGGLRAERAGDWISITAPEPSSRLAPRSRENRQLPD